MRVLDRLRDRNKLVLLGLVLSIFFSFSAWGNKLIIKSQADLLAHAKKESAEYQKIQNQFELDSLNAENLLSMYNWTLSGGVQSENAESPATSPFAPAGESSRTTTNVRVDRKTALGIDPFVELQTSDVAINFPGRPGITFQTATLETGLRLDLMRSIFNKKSLMVIKEKELRDELARLAKKNTERDFSVRVLKAYYKLLKSHRTLEILKNQCSEYNELQRISSSRFKRRLIREQDYLSIEVLYENCLLDKKSAENNLKLDHIEVVKIAGLPKDTTILLSSANFFQASKLLNDISIENNLDFLTAQKALQAAQANSASLKADLYPELNVDWSLASQASESGVGASISEAFAFDLLTYNLGLNLKYEFGGSARQINAEKSAAEQKLRALELDRIKLSLERDLNRVRESLKFLDHATAKAKKLTRLQKRKAELFNKDFANGRGGIQDLVEAQINYLNSLQRALEFSYNQSLSQIDKYSLVGESFEKFN